MRALPWIGAVTLLVGPAASQDPPPNRTPAAEQLLAEKLRSPFLRHVGWTLEFDEARRLASERGQLVFGYFTTAGP